MQSPQTRPLNSTTHSHIMNTSIPTTILLSTSQAYASGPIIQG